MPKAILFTVVRNEAPLLLEWVAYHRSIGFDEIVVYSNRSTDLTDPLLAELARNDVVRHIVHEPGERAPKPHAVTLFMKSGVFRQGDYLLALDPDEYLNIKIGRRSVQDLIEVVDDYLGLMISWRIFGDSGHERFQGRQISKDYVRCAVPDHRSSQVVKTLFRITDGFQRIRVHKPLFSTEYLLNNRCFLVGAGIPMNTEHPLHQNWVNGVNSEKSPLIAAEEVSYSLAQINHYFVRSKASFELKRRRGSDTSIPAQKKTAKSRYDQEIFQRLNRNEDVDTSILVAKQRFDNMYHQILSAGETKDLDEEVRRQFMEFENTFLSSQI